MLNLVKRPFCPICKHKVSKKHIDFKEIPIVKCTNCGFLFSESIMSENDLNTYYADGFGGNRHLKGQIVNAAVNFTIINKLVKFDKSLKVLDVGTGYGFFLHKLKKLWDIDEVGVELSKQEAEYGEVELGLNMYSKPLQETNLKHGSFDFVCAFEVIEHTIDPIGFLNELKPFLSPSGKLIIVTDNFESNVVKSLGAGWPKWIPHTHISHFAPDSINNAFKSAGLKIEVEASVTPWEHLFRSWVYKISNLKTSVEDGFNLTDELKSEMSGDYKMFKLRRFISPIWSRIFMRRDLKGAMMYIVASRL